MDFGKAYEWAMLVLLAVAIFVGVLVGGCCVGSSVLVYNHYQEVRHDK